VTAAEPSRRVVAALASDPRRRVELPGDGTTFEGDLPAQGRVRIVVADQARNETVREVDPR